MKRKINLLLILTLLVNLLPVRIAFAYDAIYILNENNVVITANGSYQVYCTDQTANTIYIANDLTDVSLDIENLSVRHSSDHATAPIDIGTGSNVTINFKGDNVLIGYDTPAIRVPEEHASVTIDGSGSMKLIGGNNSAAIGADKGKTSGEIIINSGTFDISGGDKAAAIGGGYRGDSGNITINGGTFEIISYNGGAGIGSGYEADGSEITINGGTFNITAGGGAAAIGGSYRGIGGTIKINDGDIYAVSEDGGYAIGSGRYCVGSDITIADGVDLSAFAASGIAAVEETNLTCNSIVFSGAFTGDFFTKNEEFTFTTGSRTKDVVFPRGAQEIFTTLDTTGDYTISCSQGNLTHKKKESSSSTKSEIFTITNDYQLFTLYSFCACELTEPEFHVNDIVIAKNSKSKTITLSAKNAEFTRSESCAEHTKSSSRPKYTYSIIEDRSAIAELISASKMKVTLDQPGTYTVVVRATATIGTLSSYTDTPVKVTKQLDDVDIDDEDIYIEKNGIYNIDGDSEHNSIIVADNLLDVTLVLKDADIDLSENAGDNKSPIVIGAGSKVTISTTGSDTDLKSRKDASVIQMNSSTDQSNPTTLIIRGSSGLNLTAKGKAPCISGKNNEVYILDAEVNLVSIDSQAVVCDKFFVAEDADFLAVTEKGSAAVNAKTFVSTPYEGLTPGYLFQGILNDELDIKSTANLSLKNTDSKKSVNVPSLTADTKSFSTVLPEDGYYTCSYKAGSTNTLQYLTHSDNGEDFREYYIKNTNSVFELDASKCKCKLSAPTFKFAAVTIPCDQSRKSYNLVASGSTAKLDEECLYHSRSSGIDYTFSIVDDPDGICTLDDPNLKISVDEPGKYKVRLRATANMGGVTASKEINVSINKLTEEETAKERGAEHKPYINGYEDGTFRPDKNITRAEAAALIFAVMDYNYSDSFTNLTDVKIGSWYYDYVVTMEENNILNGYEDGSFRPDDTMTRAEFCVIVCRANGIEAKSSKSKLTDLNGHWAAGYISSLIKQKAISGYTNNTFKPDAPITRAEAVKIINAVMGRTPDDVSKESVPSTDFSDLKKSHWAYYEIMEAATRHYEKEWH